MFTPPHRTPGRAALVCAHNITPAAPPRRVDAAVEPCAPHTPPRPLSLPVRAASQARAPAVVCVCVCVCVCARARACPRACMRVCVCVRACVRACVCVCVSRPRRGARAVTAARARAQQAGGVDQEPRVVRRGPLLHLLPDLRLPVRAPTHTITRLLPPSQGAGGPPTHTITRLPVRAPPTQSRARVRARAHLPTPPTPQRGWFGGSFGWAL